MDDYGNALMWVTQNENVFEVEEILTNILLRLPVKSLLICKSVSKYWRSIISRPSFVESHLIQSQHNPTYVFYPYDPWHHNVYLLRKTDGEMTESLPGCDGIYFKGIICSFNGLICCVNYYSAFLHDIRICNPATREVLLLPQSRELEHPGEVGVAFGPGINEYKVFQFYGGTQHYGCEVYSSITGSWKSIGRVAHTPYSSFSSNHVCINGIVYWFTRSEEGIGSILVVNREEIFSTIQLPKEKILRPYLINLEGCLCLVVDNGLEGYRFDIWALQDSKESLWTKKWSDYMPFCSIADIINHVVVRKNEILLGTITHFFLYNMGTRTWRKFNWEHDGEEIVICLSVPYTESLLPCK